MSLEISNLQKGIMLRFMANNRTFATGEKGKITATNQVYLIYDYRFQISFNKMIIIKNE